MSDGDALLATIRSLTARTNALLAEKPRDDDIFNQKAVEIFNDTKRAGEKLTELSSASSDETLATARSELIKLSETLLTQVFREKKRTRR